MVWGKILTKYVGMICPPGIENRFSFNEKLVWGVLSLPKGKESTPQTEKKTEIHPKSTPHPPKHIILGWARGPGVDLGNMEGYRAW